jgi:8-oxo-dGTP pyrophosphatase MutT (NUDIX family)
VHDKDKVLFIKRSATKKTLPNAWAFPSGTVEKGEKIADTALREALEELGIKVSVDEVIGTMELTEFNVRLHFVACHVTEGVPSIVEVNEIQEVKWFTFSEFFANYADKQIGHGLIYLRKHPEIYSLVQ